MFQWKFPVLILTVIMAGGASLPQEGPLPKLLDERKTQSEKDDAMPETGAGSKNEQASPGVKPEDVAREDLAVETENPAAYIQCINDLEEMGAVFKETSRIDDGNGCGLDRPLVVKSIVAGVALEPEATIRCPAALALAKWVEGSVKPAVKTAFGTGKRLTVIDQASSYVCRLRNNAETGKISEHARGNAIDIAAFRFGNNTPIDMSPRKKDETIIGTFQRAITASACLYFHTVLSPGSDPEHETHLHLDTLQRGNGYRYCR